MSLAGDAEESIPKVVIESRIGMHNANSLSQFASPYNCDGATVVGHIT